MPYNGLVWASKGGRVVFPLSLQKDAWNAMDDLIRRMIAGTASIPAKILRQVVRLALRRRYEHKVRWWKRPSYRAGRFGTSIRTQMLLIPTEES